MEILGTFRRRCVKESFEKGTLEKYKYQVSDLVEFIDSPTEAEKFALYRQCDTVLYTPPNEHFGIVPIEALEQRRPVIVCNSGGPAETVLEGITGSKIEFPDGRLLAEAMEQHMLRPIWPALDNDEDYELQVSISAVWLLSYLRC
ncbi:unnamed protein product [Toxocara canis]|uniref:Glycos_transf_1 domain-containing protein n=1 Tax=Toxocara canis TaxID=6265 RepID=A0A183VH77_TOXCA|nr:unnamed protein product [Toxocara canis]